MFDYVFAKIYCFHENKIWRFRENRKMHFYPTIVLMEQTSTDKHEHENEHSQHRTAANLKQVPGGTANNLGQTLKVPKHEIFDGVFLHISSLTRP